VDFVVDKAALVKKVFSEYFGFPLPSVPPTLVIAHHHPGWCKRPVVASKLVDWVPLHRKNK
jgi:hypothetical protein